MPRMKRSEMEITPKWLKSMCERQNLTVDVRPWNEDNKGDYFQNFLTLDEYKTIYCFIPKAGTTFLKSIIANASGLGDEDFQNVAKIGRPETGIHNAINSKYRTLGNYSMEEIDYKLQHYFKFMIVRHPFDRLVSTYVDKFYAVEHQGDVKTPPYRQFSRKIRSYIAEKKHIPARKRYYFHKKRHIHFSDFIGYIANNGPPRNEHWERYYDLCHPCAVDVDYVGKVEHMDIDTLFVLNKMNITGESIGEKHKKDHKYYSAYFDDISSNDMEALLNVYKNDFILFKYFFDSNDINFMIENLL